MPLDVRLLSQRGLYLRPTRVLGQSLQTLLGSILIPDFRIGFKNASGAVRVFCPWPMSFGGIKNLSIQKRDNKLLKERTELEFGFKEIVLIEGTAKAGALVALVEVPLRGGVYFLDVERRQARIGFVGSFFDSDLKSARQRYRLDWISGVVGKNQETVALGVVARSEFNGPCYRVVGWDKSRMCLAQPLLIVFFQHG
jgi:hypothetical protein